MGKSPAQPIGRVRTEDRVPGAPQDPRRRRETPQGWLDLDEHVLFECESELLKLFQTQRRLRERSEVAVQRCIENPVGVGEASAGQPLWRAGERVIFQGLQNIFVRGA